MYCKECGEQNPDGAKFCRRCGTMLAAPVAQAAAGARASDAGSNRTYVQVNVPPYQAGGSVFGPGGIPMEYRPIGMWGYFGYAVLFSIPVIGWIIALVFALGGSGNVNLRNYARSMFCGWILSVLTMLFVLPSIVASMGYYGADYRLSGTAQGLLIGALVVLALLCVIFTLQGQKQTAVNNIPEEYRPIGMWGYFGYNLLFMIPIVGLIIVIVKAVGAPKNINVRNYARSMFCALILAVALFLIVAIISGILAASVY